MYFTVRDFARTERAFAVRGHASDFLDQFHCGVITLAEDGVFAIEAGVGNFSDEELRAIGVGSGIGVGDTPWAIEGDGRRSFIFEFVAGIARAIAFGISALNHETGDHAVKDGAIIKWNAVLLCVRDGAGPIFCAAREADEILDSDRSDFWIQRAMQVARRGVDDSGGLRGSSGGGGSGLAYGRFWPCRRLRS